MKKITILFVAYLLLCTVMHAQTSIINWGFYGSSGNGGWSFIPGDVAGNATIKGNATPSTWSILRGGFETLTPSLTKAVRITGKVKFTGDINSWSALRYGFYYSDSAGVLTTIGGNSSTTYWNGKPAYNYGYLFTPYSRNNEPINWNAGNPNGTATHGGIYNRSCTSTMNGADNYIIGEFKPRPIFAELKEGTYNFAFSVQPLANGTSEIRFYLIRDDNKYYFGGTSIDTVTWRKPTKFNSLTFGLNPGCSSVRQMDMINVEASLGDPIVIPAAPQQFLEVESNNTLAQAMNIAYGNVVTASISPAGDVDYYKIQAAAGDTLMVYTENNNSQLYGDLSLLDQNGNYIASHITNYTGSSYIQRYVCIVPNTATYFIRYSFNGNQSGMPQAEIDKQKQQELGLKGRIEYSLPPGTRDQGDYYIMFEHFKTSWPIVVNPNSTDLNYNSVRFNPNYYPNGLPSTVTVEYGLTINYGNSIVVASGVNNFNEVWSTSNKITGLTANTTYHCRAKIENSKGVHYSWDFTFTTPEAPNGWSSVFNGTTNQLRGVKFFDSNVGYAVGDNVIIKTMDGGKTWNQKKSFNNYQGFNSIDVIDVNTVVAAGYNNSFTRTTDGGQTWTDKTPTGCYGVMGISFKDGSNGVMVTDCSQVYKTTDGGTSWNQLTLGVTASQLNAVKYFSNNLIIAAGGNRYVIRSTDGGSTWTSQQLAGDYYAFWNMSFKDNSNGIMVGFGGMTYKTTDAGATWTSLNQGHTFYQWDVNYQSNGTAISVGDAGTIYKSTDNGATWNKQQCGTMNNLYGVTSTSSSQVFTVGDWGTMLTDKSKLSVTFQVNMNIYKTMQIFNPATDKVYLRGSFNGWAQQDILTDPDNDGIYTLVYPLDENSNYEYKYFITSSKASNYGWEENVGNGDGGNRQLTTSTVGVVLPVNNFNNLINPIKLVSPNGGEQWKQGSVRKIQWFSGGIDNIKIEFSSDNGANYAQVTASVPASTGGYGWTLPNVESSLCKIRISNVANASVYDESDGTFNIKKSGPIPEIESNNTTATAMNVSYADTVNASVNPIGDIDYYKIQAAMGDTLMVYAENRNGSQLFGDLSLLDQNGNYIVSHLQNFTGSQNKQRYVYIIPNSSTYYIRYSYNGNQNGMPPVSIDKMSHVDLNEFGNKINGPQLGTNDQGDYQIIFNYFKKAAPILGYPSWADLNFNSVRFNPNYVPNGLPTTVTVEYGLTTSYGNNVVAATGIDNINEVWSSTDKITGLTANTYYHYRVKAENSKGVVYSGDYNFTTPSVPDGWTRLNIGTMSQLKSIDFYDDLNGVVLASWGKEIYFTTDGGESWINKYPSDESNLNWWNEVEYVSANKVVAVGFSGNRIYTTTDKGNSWNYKEVGNQVINSISFYDNNIGAIVNNSEVYKTTDGGGTWTLLTSTGNTWLHRVKMIKSDVIIALGYENRIYRSVDGGNSWEQQQLGTGYQFDNIDFIDQNNGFICSRGNILLKTTDGGKTWEAIPVGNTGELFGVALKSSSSIVTAGANGAIYSSSNAGSLWKSESSGTRNFLFDVAITPSGRTFIVGDWGTILKSQNYLRVVSPNGGEHWKSGSVQNITWVSGGVSNVKIEFSSDNGVSYSPVAVSVSAGLGSYSWTVPNTISSQCRIKISNVDDASMYDVSDAGFNILLPGVITESEPNNTIATAMDVAYADTVNASINPIGDIDYYKMQAAAGDTLVVYAENRNGSQLTANLSMLDQNGSYIQQTIQNFAGSSYKQRFVWVVPATATYYFRYAFWSNWNGAPTLIYDRNKDCRMDDLPKPILTDGASNDQGDYFITFNKFKKASPIISSLNPVDFNFSSTRISVVAAANGSPTTGIVECGPTTSYGQTVPIPEFSNLNETGTYSSKIMNLQPATLYHYRVTLQNAKGTAVSNDYTFTTPSLPQGWTFQPSNTKEWLMNLSFADNSIGMAVGTNGEIIKTTDGGTSWTKINSGTTEWLWGIKMTSTQNAIVVGYNGTLRKTTDGGVTWQSKLEGNNTNLFDVDFFNPNNGFVVGDNGTILRTTDGGSSWTTQQSGNGLRYYGVSMPSINMATVVGWNGTILHTLDGGLNWTQQTSNSTKSLYEVDFLNEQQGGVVSVNSTILKTGDAGTTWTQQNLGNPNALFEIKIKDNMNAYVAGANGILAKTDDGAASWKTQICGTYNTLEGIAFPDPNTVVVVGDWGTILKSSNVSFTITSFTPTTGLAGTEVTIVGTGFGATQGTSVVKFGGMVATPTSWSDTQIKVKVPVRSGGIFAISITVNNITIKSSTSFTIFSAPYNVYLTNGNALSGEKYKTQLVTDGYPIPTYVVNQKPAAMTAVGDSLFWTPGANEFGMFPIIVTATNDYGSVRDTVTIISESLKSFQNQIRADLTNRGKIGVSGFYDKGLFYNGKNGLYAGDFSIVDRNGLKYAGGLYTTTNSFKPVEGFTPTTSKYSGFSAFKSSFDDSWEFNRIGVKVEETAHVSTAVGDDKYVLVDYKVSNTSGAPLDDLFLQLTEDLDVGNAGQNLGAYNSDLQMTYLYEVGGPTNSNYYGFSLLGKSISGQAIYGNGQDQHYQRSVEKLTVSEPNPTLALDYRSQLTSGPYSLGVNESMIITYAIFAGDNLNDITASATRAKQIYNSNIFSWQNSLTITDKSSTGTGAVSFGTATTATDGLDADLGESVLPPAPPTGIFDARLILPNGTDASLKDYRRDGQENVTWTLTFQPGSSGYPIAFTWDKTKFPAEGSFMLCDDVNGSLVNVDMKANTSYSLTIAGIKTLLIKYSKTLKSNVALSKDWNILSVPVKTANMNTTVMFPDYNSQTYWYDGGYKTVTTLENGKGYWLKYKKDSTIAVSGEKVNLTTIPVKKDWNLIGPYDWEVLVSGITTTPSSIISSKFYEYKGGYVEPTKLVPGKGYWIKVTADGVLNLPPASSPSADIVAAKMVNGSAIYADNERKEGLNISVSDAGGRSGELTLLKEVASISMYDLPPLPPKGIFEVRWGSDRKIEKRGEGAREIVISSAEYPVTLRVSGGDIRVKDNLGGMIINQIVKKGESITINQKSIERLLVEELEIPTEFRLCQNYPNPFNPETKIEYWIPEAGKVTLKIYDVLGREVETLVDLVQEAGKYEVRWNAGRYSSGVYFYNIINGNNHSVKKMLMIK